MSAAENLRYTPTLSVAYPRTYTVAKYLEIEANSDEKLDFVNGYIIKAEAGGTFAHALIGMNIGVALKNALKGKPCKVLGSDMKIKIEDVFRFADALVVCGEPEFHNTKKTALSNPTVLIEVVSADSDKRDYITKRLEYFKIPSLRHYIVVEQALPFVSLYTKTADNLQFFADYDAENPMVPLPALEISLNLVDIYESVF
jgi:Uma2 family endonuclease